MNEILHSLDKLVEALRFDNSRDYKLHVLRSVQDESLKSLVVLIYDPRYLFYLTGKRVAKESYSYDHKVLDLDIVTLLTELHHKHVTGDDALHDAVGLYNAYPEYRHLIVSLLDKDLDCGIGVKTINAAWPGAILDFKSRVPLATKYKRTSVDYKKYDWWISRKLDGVRCLCFIQDGNVSLYSRNGIPFETLDTLRTEIESNGPWEDQILDGELCTVDENGDEDFSGIITQIRRKNHDVENVRYHVFGSYSPSEWMLGVGGHGVPTYPSNLLFDGLWKGDHVVKVKQQRVINRDHLKEIVDGKPEKWEGFIIRRYPVVFKRSNTMMKIKLWKEAEFTVVGWDETLKRIDGVQVNCIGALHIKYKGFLVKVGTGISDDQRIAWLEKGDMLGKKITVKYFSESQDKNGNVSLRFPEFRGIRNYE